MPLLKDYKCKIAGKDIYLELNIFKKYCDECNISVNDRLLELYESHWLVYPIYRLVRSKEYLQKLFEQRHKADGNRIEIEVPEEYENLIKFEFEKLAKWRHSTLSEFNEALAEGHPLDQAYRAGEPYVHTPSKDTAISESLK